MHLDFVVNQVLPLVYWLLPIAIVAAAVKSPWFKGMMGELQVRFFGWLRLPSDIYRRIHNVTLKTPDGTTQIDHIFISRFGIFVVETKNMRGWIFGGEHQAHWTQKIYNKSFRFQNPLRQNYKHTKALAKLLGLPEHFIHSVIVFVGSSTFKTKMPDNVTKEGGCIRYIKSFRSAVLTNEEVENLVSRIQSGRLAPTRETHKQHIQNLKSRNNPEAERLCPKCGSPMVRRTSKRGVNAGKQFWGCSAFPKCRVIQNIR
ncbi:Topoisomerase DNA binding C4 zinc finger [Microbulbifer thermotolerans]|uniref:nuclease-related domain-containing protein n=1 Tax=Microbulbifer thermotolerans TaxID=252514 RepID=UPI0008F3E51B|nr:NERD domain-containing protein [Microbulbifer thermotolerans]SFD13565.1 Topoisomerase DNA binding C4 zinc finger [Microbulbifer thermotolerans]